MKKKRVDLIDFLSYSMSHVKINSTFIKVLLSKKSCQLHIHCEKEHGNRLVESQSSQLNTSFYSKVWGWRLIREFLFLITIIKLTFDDDRDSIVVLGATGVQLFTLAIICSFSKKLKTKLHVILHSEVEGIRYARGIQKRFANIALNRFCLHSKAKCAVLGKHIKDNLLKICPSYEAIYVIRHPFYDESITKLSLSQENFAGKYPVRLGVVGLIREDTKDLALANALHNQKNIEVCFLGRLSKSEILTRLTPGSQITYTHYSEDWISEKLINIDFLLLIPNRSRYQFTALGTVSDSILYGKPAAWISHDALKEYEDFPLAVVAEDIDSLRENLINFRVGDLNEVAIWVNNWNGKSKREFLDFVGVVDE